MSKFFGKSKTNSVNEERIRFTKLHVEQQIEENNALRQQLEELKDQTHRNKVMLDETLSNVSLYENSLKDLEQENQKLELECVQQEATIKKLKEENDKLKSEKFNLIRTDFQISGSTSDQSIQEILDQSEKHQDLIFFKDNRGNVWQIVKKPGLKKLSGGQNPLMQACEQGNLNQLRQLIPQFDIDEKNHCGYTALQICAKQGFDDLAAELLNHGADVNSTNNAGQSVLYVACWYNREQCVKLLLLHHADVNQQDKKGWTPLVIAAHRNYINIVQLLLQHGANPNHKDHFGKGAIDRVKSVQMSSLLQRYTFKAHESRRSLSRSSSLERSSSRSSNQSRRRNWTPQRDLNREKVSALDQYRQKVQREIKSKVGVYGNQIAQEIKKSVDEQIQKEIAVFENQLWEEVDITIVEHGQKLYQELGVFALSQVEQQCKKAGLVVQEYSDFEEIQLKTLTDVNVVLSQLPELKDFKRFPTQMNNLYQGLKQDKDLDFLKKDFIGYIDKCLLDLEQRLVQYQDYITQEQSKHQMQQLHNKLEKAIDIKLRYVIRQIKQSIEQQVLRRLDQIMDEEKSTENVQQYNAVQNRKQISSANHNRSANNLIEGRQGKSGARPKFSYSWKNFLNS